MVSRSDPLWPYIERERWIRQQLTEVFTSWGYRQVRTPLCIPADGEPDRLQTLTAAEICRFFDANGRMWALRPDMTDAIARMVDRELRNEPRPLRLWYMEDIFRRTGHGLFQNQTQAGVEQIGDDDGQADREILLLTLHCLRELGLYQAKVAIGHIGVITDLMNGWGISKDQIRRILFAMERRDHVKVWEIIRSLMPEEKAAQLQSLLVKRYTVDELLTEPLHFSSTQHTSFIHQLITEVKKAGFAEQVVFEMGLVGSFSYYTGMVFEIFTPEVAEPLGSGGRYDDLLAAYGKPEPAVGFAFHLDSLVKGSFVDR